MIFTLLAMALKAASVVARDRQRSSLLDVAGELRALDRPQAPAPTSSR
ncbi:MAG: hypothetical protein ACREDK_07015 [Thermoplasmata archaeon]